MQSCSGSCLPLQITVQMFLLIVFSSRVALPLLYFTFPFFCPGTLPKEKCYFSKYSIYTARNKNTEVQLLFEFLPAKFTPNIQFWNPPQVPLRSFKCSRNISSVKLSADTNMLYSSPHSTITQQILEGAVQMKDFVNLFWSAIIIDGTL